jgi:DNA-binding NarL/FixJ family response regulator
MDNVKILLADDHAVLRQGLRRILEDRPDWRVVAEASNGRDAVAEADMHRPHVAVLDIAMPILNGIEATRQIMRRSPEIHVLILSMHSDQAYVTQAVQAGAKGYVLKESVGADIIQAVAALAAGKTFFSPPVAEVMLDDYVRNLTEKGI